ncbi:hypothetical protein Ahy_B06g083817 [Arachis hypogaea]|uniref:Uncharacterized protein n=1 Tax=Arachis hypogaea TaxID=3818 RepID=A0A444YQL5_ARAHY|nr:hypothetical protein Ahy_B06g083817 [Arachis hypogaea]
MYSDGKLRTKVPSLVVMRVWKKWKSTLLRIVSLHILLWLQGGKAHSFDVERHSPSYILQEKTSTNGGRNSEPSHENLDTNANEEDSLDQEVDDFFVASRAQNSDGTIKLAKLSVREAIERPNGKMIMLKVNNKCNQLETKLNC